MRSPGRHRLYTHAEVAALRDALEDGLSISSAITRARESLSSTRARSSARCRPSSAHRADATMEAALALRSVERSVEQVLLPALEEIGDRHGVESAPWAFAARWAAEWLGRALRITPPPMRAARS